MDTSYLYIKTGAQLKLLAKQAGIKLPSGATKAQMIQLLLEAEEKRAKEQAAAQAEAPSQTKAPVQTEAPAQRDAPAEPAAEAPAPRKRGRPRKNPLPEDQSAPAKPRGRKPKAAPDQEDAKTAPADAPKAESSAPDAEAPAPKAETSAPKAEIPAPKAEAPAPKVGKPTAKKPGRASKAPTAKDSAATDAVPDATPQAEAQSAEPTQEKAPDGDKPHPLPLQPPLTVPQLPAQPRRGFVRRNLKPKDAFDAGEPEGQTPKAASPAQTDPSLSQPEAPLSAPEAEEAASQEAPKAQEAEVRLPEAPQGDWGEGHGVLELLPDGYGFLRADNCLPGPRDVYLSQTQIRRFNLRNGDYITGKTRPQREGDRYEGMIFVSTVNGVSADAARRRPHFEDLTPVFPNERLRLEDPAGHTDMALRIVDLLSPIGKGQRGLVVSPPKAGKTMLLKKIANAISINNPEVHLIVLLIDERPEEVTDMQRSTNAEVLYSTFDEAPENHTRLSEMVLDRAQRQVEMGKDVVILLDSITRLARAYNLVIPPTGRSLSGGLDPGALLKPKKFFGAARNIENGGSLTIIATALVDTGSRMDDIIYEEFKGTGNMELHLDRRLSERRIFPAIDMNRSGTRRDDLLYTPTEAAGALQIRRTLAQAAGSTDSTEQLMSLMEKTSTNEELISRMKAWIAALGK